MKKGDMITSEILALAKKVLPPVTQMAEEVGVSRVTMSKALHGKSNNKKAIDYILNKTAIETEKIKSLTTRILKNAS